MSKTNGRRYEPHWTFYGVTVASQKVVGAMLGSHRWVQVTSAPMNESAMLVTDGDATVLVLRAGLLPAEVMGWLAGADGPTRSRLRLWRDASIIATLAFIAHVAS